MSTLYEIARILLSFINISFDIGFIFLPCLGYIHQYFKIRRLRTSQGFSKMVSLIILVAFILRIFFWVGKRFSNVILYQCIAGILMQMILLHKCVEFSPDKNLKNTESNYLSIKDFWNWPYYEDFFLFILFFIILVSSTSILIGFDNIYYIEFIGTMSAIVEAFLGVPQIIEIFRTQKVKALSYVMILGWLIGDFIKFLFYVKSSSPIQLTLTAVAQFTFDVVIILQIFYYTKIKPLSEDFIYEIVKEEKKGQVAQ
jgi:hypothetical protein